MIPSQALSGTLIAALGEELSFVRGANSAQIFGLLSGSVDDGKTGELIHRERRDAIRISPEDYAVDSMGPGAIVDLSTGRFEVTATERRNHSLMLLYVRRVP